MEMNEAMEDSEEEIFSDVTPLNGDYKTGESIRMSTITIYHSAVDLMPPFEEERMFKNSVGLRDLIPIYYPKLRYFRDNIRSIDYVMAWVEETDLALRAVNKHRRRIFETRLIDNGLELELETFGSTFRLVKVHAPIGVLKTYCDVLRLRMPIKEIPGDIHKKKSRKTMDPAIGRQSRSVDLSPAPTVRRFLTTAYRKEKNYLFDEHDEHFFTPLVKTTVVNYMLERAGIRIDAAGYTLTNVGLHKMVNDDVYKAAYSLHDGRLDDTTCLRRLLVKNWASLTKIFNFQPIDHIKEYFGTKIAVYFTWLGFYTAMLIPAAIFGTICFLYGCFTQSFDPLSSDVCNLDYVMCPRCNEICDYWRLNELCSQRKMSYTVDNPSTVAFSLFMLLWASIYLKLWKRYSASIAHRWSIAGHSPPNEPSRPRSFGRTEIKKNADEWYVPFWKRRPPQTLVSFALAMFILILIFVAVLSVAFYQISLIAAFSITGPNKNRSYLHLGTLIIAAILNLLFTLTFNYFYRKIALFVTEWELWRTQNEFDDSVSVKICLFEFVNFFASILFIALVKGKFVVHSGDYLRIFRIPKSSQEECNSPVGCMFELTVHVATTLLGLQAVNGLIEMFAPMVAKCLKLFEARKSVEGPALKNLDNEVWTEDYKLLEYRSQRILDKYQGKVVQYGFVALFASAFPLAPLFALINNGLEIRLDAKKLLTSYRRPAPVMASDIGIWHGILSGIGKLAIFSNGLIIAFTSTFIPQLVYKYVENPRRNFDGYLNASLGVFYVTNFEPGTEPKFSNWNVTTCRFPSLSNDNVHYWHVLAARLAFFIAFQITLFLTVTLITWLIPDIPSVVSDQMTKEEFLTNELIIQHETARARKVRMPSGTSLNSDESLQEKAGTSSNHVEFSDGS